MKRSLRLASRLRERHLRTGAQSDFDEAIQVVETNLALAPEDDPDRGRAFHILGNVIGERFCMMGSMDHLDESIRLAQKAVQVMPDTYYELPLFLMSLGFGLTDRYDRTGRLADLEEGIRICERALDQTHYTIPTAFPSLYTLLQLYKYAST